MKINEAVAILKHFNEWRRGEIDNIDYSPKEIGIAIDVVLKYVKLKLNKVKNET